MAPPELPAELLFLIIDELRDDPDTLKACSLASTVLLHAARPLLFRHLTVKAVERSFEDLHKFIHDAPDVARYVQVLTLSGWPKFVDYLHGVHHTTTISTMLLADIVALLPHLHTLELTFLILERAPATPSELITHASLKSLALSACTASALTDYLHLLHMFQSCTKELRISGFRTDELVVPWLDLASQAERLAVGTSFPHDLALESAVVIAGPRTGFVFELLRRTRSVHTLTELEVGFERPEQVEHFGAFLAVAGRNIQTLKLGMSEMLLAFYQPGSITEIVRMFNLEACPNLHTLILDFPLELDLIGPVFRRAKTMFLLAEGLLAAASPDSLQRVVFRAHVQFNEERDAQFLKAMLDALEVLGDIEDTLVRKRAVRKVSIGFMNYALAGPPAGDRPPEGVPIDDGIGDFLKQKMPKLVERGILMV